MMLKKNNLVSLSITVFVAAVFTVGSQIYGNAADTSKPSDYPNQQIEFVPHTNPGDSLYQYSDNAARLLNSKKIVNQKIVVVPKAGGSGSIADTYISQKKNDPYFLRTCQPSSITTPIIQKLKISYKQFTPIVGLLSDECCIVVKQDSKYKSITELAAQAKKSPKSVSMGGTQYGAADSIVTYMTEKETGAKFNYVSFKSSGETLVALLGGNIDAMATKPNNVIGQVQAGTVRVLAVASEKRSPYLPQTPIFREEGMNVVLHAFRGFMAPGGISEDVVRYWENAFFKLRNDPDWKQILKDNQYVDLYMDSKTFKGYLEEQEKFYRQLLAEMGLLK
jgi:putative tricarboxylic transport membrane protein